MNYIIICTFLFINILELKQVSSLSPFYKSLQNNCDEISNPNCVTERSLTLQNLLGDSKDGATFGINKHQGRLQILVPTNTLPRKRNNKIRNKNKLNKRNRNKKAKSFRRRHSKNKLSRRVKTLLQGNQKMEVTFEKPLQNQPIRVIDTSRFPLHNFDFSNNEIGRSSNNSEFRGRKKHKGVVSKGGKGRRRNFNPKRGAKKVIVRTHNILRGRVWPPAQDMLAMSWNSQAAEQAQIWADECSIEPEIDHPSVRWTPLYGTCGQNVHISFKKKRWGRVLHHWWNEKRNFRYGHAGNNDTNAHMYSQMVWYNSHKVGCGFSQCSTSTGKTFYRYVCNYCPGGNDPRRISRPYTEGTPCASCQSSCRSVCKGGCKLCTNACPFSDLWSNCESLAQKWKQWLCNTKTSDGILRFKNCRATCQCQDKIT